MINKLLMSIYIFGIEYDLNTQQIELSFKKIKEIPKEIQFLTQLTNLYLHNNYIKEIPKEIQFLTQLTYLYLNYNEIKEIPKEIQFLTQLNCLYLNYNKIEEIPKDIQYLTKLTFLCLKNNQIKEIPKEIQFLTQLTQLYIHSNQIKEIPKEIQFLTQLTKLYIHSNQIKEIPKEIQFLIQLTYLNLSINQITEIPKEIQFLTQLTQLFLYYNQIKEIPNEIQFLIQLTHLYLHNNQINELPLEIINLRNLIDFYYHNNPIENLLNPIINRFINRINNKQIYNIHNDTQNVHSSSIQQSIKDNIFNLLKQLKEPYKYNYLDDLVLTQQTKEQLIEYSNCTDIHTQLECTFEELLNAIFYEINSFELEKQISAKKRINEEMLDGLCMCFTGRLSRLVNSLSGLSEKVSIKISENEEISNIIILANKKYKKIEEIKDYVKKEMTERLYNESLIEEWLNYID
jgi:Leucine-rich repeat (LRR) protein